MNRVKWWMVVLPVLLVVVLVVTLCWDAIYIRVAPSIVLAEAMTNTIAELSTRGQGTPLEMMSAAVDEEGKYTSELNMTVDYASMMSVDAALVAQYDPKNFCSQMDMQINAALYSYLTLDANLGFYADQDHIMANWAELFGDTYYGIALETFGEDVRSNPLVYNAIGEDVLVELEKAIALYRQQMALSAEYPDLEETKEKLAIILLDFIKEHKPSVDTEQLMLYDTEQKCYTITYTATSDELADLIEALSAVLDEDEALQTVLEQYFQTYEDNLEDMTWDEYWEGILSAYEELADTIRDSDGTGTMAFFLFNEKVVDIRFAFDAADSNLAVSLSLGENSAQNDIVLLYEYDGEENSGALELKLSTVKVESRVEERLFIDLRDEIDDVDLVLGYAWDQATGEFSLAANGTDNGEPVAVQVDMTLRKETTGFRLEIPDLYAAFSQFTAESEAAPVDLQMGLQFYIYPGATITKPEFTNIRELDEGAIDEMGKNLLRSYGFR